MILPYLNLFYIPVHIVLNVNNTSIDVFIQYSHMAVFTAQNVIAQNLLKCFCVSLEHYFALMMLITEKACSQR